MGKRKQSTVTSSTDAANHHSAAAAGLHRIIKEEQGGSQPLQNLGSAHRQLMAATFKNPQQPNASGGLASAASHQFYSGFPTMLNPSALFLNAANHASLAEDLSERPSVRLHNSISASSNVQLSQPQQQQAQQQQAHASDATNGGEADGDGGQGQAGAFAAKMPRGSLPGQLLYTCTECQRSFKQMGQLKQHLRVHTQERPFGCTYCKKGFKQQAHLQAHVRALHTGEKPFVCPIEGCTEAFSQISNLQSHLKRGKHGASAPRQTTTTEDGTFVLNEKVVRRRTSAKKLKHLCEFCAISFAKATDLKHHLDDQHPEHKAENASAGGASTSGFVSAVTAGSSSGTTSGPWQVDKTITIKTEGGSNSAAQQAQQQQQHQAAAAAKQLQHNMQQAQKAAYEQAVNQQAVSWPESQALLTNFSEAIMGDNNCVSNLQDELVERQLRIALFGGPSAAHHVRTGAVPVPAAMCYYMIPHPGNAAVAVSQYNTAFSSAAALPNSAAAAAIAYAVAPANYANAAAGMVQFPFATAAGMSTTPQQQHQLQQYQRSQRCGPAKETAASHAANNVEFLLSQHGIGNQVVGQLHATHNNGNLVNREYVNL